MRASCGHHRDGFDGLSADYKLRLWLVIVVNGAMFVVSGTCTRKEQGCGCRDRQP